MTKTVRLSMCNLFAAMSIASAWFAMPAFAVTPDEMLRNPVLEKRARAISQNLRCVVCQNQSIDDSNAPLAHDLRVLVRERLAAGDSDQRAVDFIAARYGNFVLLNPPLQLNTVALWIGPALFVVIGAIGFGRYLRGRSSDEAGQHTIVLTTAEQQHLEELLSKRRSA